jgi:hypothetical protein
MTFAAQLITVRTGYNANVFVAAEFGLKLRPKFLEQSSPFVVSERVLNAIVSWGIPCEPVRKKMSLLADWKRMFPDLGCASSTEIASPFSQLSTPTMFLSFSGHESLPCVTDIAVQRPNAVRCNSGFRPH